MSQGNSSEHRAILPALDPGFFPPIEAHQTLAGAAKESSAVDIGLAVEREQSMISRFDLRLPSLGNAQEALARRFLDRLIKTLLWSRGGWRLHIAAPRPYAEQITAAYSPRGERAFDADFMGRIHERDFVVRICSPDELPVEETTSSSLGGNLDGCRLGFDLGASDYKVAALQDGAVVFSEEIPWNPVPQVDPDWHFEQIDRGLRRAAEHLPRVDAIGGSTAGVVIENRLMTASLIRSVPDADIQKARTIFQRLQEKWGVPLVVLNDGEVTALTASISLNVSSVLGIAMGSSEATGYLDPEGRITGWLNELAFAPVDIGEEAAIDEWSKDRGVGAQYFSQQAVARLMPRSGLETIPEEPLPECLERVSRLAASGDERAVSIFETIGSYLGFTLPWYRLFYDFANVMILGRVTSREGGRLIKERARHVIERAYPDMARMVRIHLPDERSRRVGQAVGAASLPVLSSDREAK